MSQNTKRRFQQTGAFDKEGLAFQDIFQAKRLPYKRVAVRNYELEGLNLKDDFTEVWQSTISKRLLINCLLLSNPFNELTIMDRQADRKTTNRGTSLGSTQKFSNLDLGGALKSASQGPF